MVFQSSHNAVVFTLVLRVQIVSLDQPQLYKELERAVHRCQAGIDLVLLGQGKKLFRVDERPLPAQQVQQQLALGSQSVSRYTVKLHITVGRVIQWLLGHASNLLQWICNDYAKECRHKQ